ncbi:MAG: KH domain-containing protein [Treponema sp.]|jgi:predicted RNA-binding protein YlqC (UPF0109 family)|nr:KH domain-containing protein [Treponema sp.]
MQKELVEYIAKSIADDPDSVSVTETEDEGGAKLELRVTEGDLGRVIGKGGRIARSIRTVMSAAVNETGKRYSLDILD